MFRFALRSGVTLLSTLLALTVFTSAETQAQSTAASSQDHEDVSLDPITGDTFIVTVNRPTESQILWLNDHNDAFEKHLALPLNAARAEVELNTPHTLTTLLQIGDNWVLTGHQKSPNGEWSAQPVTQAIAGVGQASRLTTLPDGNLVFTVEHQDRESEVLLVRSPNDSTARYQVLESIPEDTLAERAEALAQNLAKTASASEENQLESGNGLGFTAGLLSGIGIAYRRHFANKWGIQVGGIAFGDRSSLLASLGANLMRTLSMTQKVRFYAVFGASTFYSGSQGYDYSGIPVDCYETGGPKACEPAATGWVNSASLNFGAGLGMEFVLAKNLGLAIELPVTVMLDINDAGLTFGRVYPIPTGSLIYYF
jgi:hypothetical protein